jgi:hydroxymethylpyrimidine pyrophosphatase-like HAD family hydrolase
LSHKEANKGVALQKLLDHYNIDRSEILVFGDYLNDIEMLRMTPNSVAMGNAHPEIKAMASIVTESHDNFGVERVLQELLKH